MQNNSQTQLVVHLYALLNFEKKIDSASIFVLRALFHESLQHSFEFFPTKAVNGWIKTILKTASQQQQQQLWSRKRKQSGQWKIKIV